MPVTSDDGPIFCELLLAHRFVVSAEGIAAGPVSEVVRPQEGKRMTDADLDGIESALALKLPESYRRFMLDYPQWLPAQQPDWSDVEKWELANDPKQVIRFNRYVRGFGPGEFFDDGPWPDHYFVIGSEHDQNWFFLDLASGSDAVFLFHHEEGEVRREAAALAEFPSALVAWWEGVEADSE
jgi:hypothetical protein